MRCRIIYIIKVYLAFLIYFIVQKPVFMLYNEAVGKGCTPSDFTDVMMHGVSLDSTTAAYMTALPWLAMLVSWWWKTFNLKKVIAAYYAIVCLLLSLIFIADMVVYPFWGFKLDASVFLYIDSPKNVAASVSAWFLIVRFAVIFLLAYLTFRILMKFTPGSLPDAKDMKSRLTGTLLSLVMGGLIFVAIRGGVKESTANIGQVYYCNNEFLNHSAVNPAFSLLASASKTDNYAEKFDYFDEDERKELFDGLFPTGGGNAIKLLNTDRPNVLIILMEGFGATMVTCLGGEADVSPNIDRLAKEGIWFTRCYANSFRTDRGTVCTFSGYQSFPDVSVMKVPAKSRTLPAIAGKLRQEGYKTQFLYGGDINFTNMKSYLLQSGYESLTADTDFPLDQRKNPWGANDDVTFDYLYEALKDRDASYGRWHYAFLTLSSHEPFEVPYSRLNEAKPNSFAFTDDCLGRFIDRMKQTPAWDDLLIVLLPDHGFHYPNNVGTVNDMRVHHIPMLWLGGAVREPRVIDKLMCQTDMAATLLGQMEIDHSEFNFSRNVTGEEYVYPFVYYTYNNGIAFADSTGYSLVNVVSGMVTEDSSAEGSERRVRLGKAILQSSYDDLGNR